MNRFALISIATTLIVGPACLAEDSHFAKCKIASPSEPRDVPVELTVSDDRLTAAGRSGSPHFEILFSSTTRIAYAESSHHRLGTGAKIAMISPGIGAATMLSKKRDQWLFIEWAQDG